MWTAACSDRLLSMFPILLHTLIGELKNTHRSLSWHPVIANPSWISHMLWYLAKLGRGMFYNFSNFASFKWVFPRLQHLQVTCLLLFNIPPAITNCFSPARSYNLLNIHLTRAWSTSTFDLIRASYVSWYYGEQRKSSFLVELAAVAPPCICLVLVE